MSEPVDLPEHGESGLVFVLIFEILKLDLVAQCSAKVAALFLPTFSQGADINLKVLAFFRPHITVPFK